MEKMKIIVFKKKNENKIEFRTWVRFLFLQIIAIGCVWGTFHIPTMWTEVTEAWSKSNLLDALGIGFIQVITILFCISLTIFLFAEIIYILYKVYTYFFKKDKNALRDILEELVYSFRK